MAPIIREFITEKECLVRGLAHPLIFQGNSGSNTQMERFQKFGAVEVSPQNIFAVSKQWHMTRNDVIKIYEIITFDFRLFGTTTTSIVCK